MSSALPLRRWPGRVAAFARVEPRAGASSTISCSGRAATCAALSRRFIEVSLLPDKKVACGILPCGASPLAAIKGVGRLNDAARADDDLLNRFGDNPDVSEPVSRALRNRAARLLEKPGGVDEVLAISERLRVFVAQEPEDSLAGVAENVNAHLNDLVSVAGGPVSFIAMTVAGMGLQGLGRLDALICRVRPRLGAKLGISGKLHGLVGVLGPLEPARRRLIQALNVSRELIDRTGQSDDLVLRRQWATAQIYRAAALMALGRPAEAFEAFGAIQSAEETGGSAALSWFADHTKTTDVTGKVTKFAFSRLHAEARETQQ